MSYEEFRDYLKANKMSFTGFCRLIGYGPSYVRSAIKGKHNIGQKLATIIYHSTNGDVDFRKKKELPANHLYRSFEMRKTPDNPLYSVFELSKVPNEKGKQQQKECD